MKRYALFFVMILCALLTAAPFAFAGTLENGGTVQITSYTPTPSPVPMATPEPEREASPEADPTPVPAVTPLPTPEPTPELTPGPTPEPTPEPIPEPTRDPDTYLTITLCGRAGLGETLSARSRNNSLTAVAEGKEDGWLLESLAETFGSDDLTLAALTVPLADLHTEKGVKTTAMIAPTSAVRFLKAAGVDAVSLVGGDLLDFGMEGYESTRYTLKEADVMSFGTLGNGIAHDADEVLVWQAKGVSIGLAGFAHEAGVKDEAVMLERIRLLRSHGCDIIIVSVAWGSTDSTAPSSDRISLAKRLIDGGADVVWGHGPALLQSLSFYQGKPILFSSGTLVDGYSGAVGTMGAAIRLEYDLTGGAPVLRVLSAIPIKTGGRGVYQPVELQIYKNRYAVFARLATVADKKELVSLPRGFNTAGTVLIGDDGSLSLPEE